MQGVLNLFSHLKNSGGAARFPSPLVGEGARRVGEGCGAEAWNAVAFSHYGVSVPLIRPSGTFSHKGRRNYAVIKPITDDHILMNIYIQYM